MAELQQILITVNPVFEWSDEADKYVLVSHDGQYYDTPKFRFDRSLVNQAKTAGNTATTTAAGYGQAGGQIAGQLTPTLEQEAEHPTGFSPTDINNQIVAGAQAAGGTTGAGGLASPATTMATRSRNVGALSGVLDQASRQRMGQLSNNSLNVLNKNANLKQEQQQNAQSELSKLYGTDVNAQLGSQGQVSNDVNAATNASKVGWLQNAEGVMGAIGDLGKGAGSVMTGMYGNQGMMNS